MAKMEIRRVPGGPSVFLTDNESDTDVTWFVDSVNGTNGSGYGREKTKPLASLAYLLTNATTLGLAAGDNIELAPSHNEGIANAQIDLDVASINVYGHPEATGSRRPTFDFDHANASIDIGANNITLRNVILRPSITSVLIGVDIEASVVGTTLQDVEFAIGEDGAGADEFVKAIHLTSANHDTTIRDCKILAHASAAQATHGIHVDAASNRLTLDSVLIDGPYATNGILEDAAGLNHVVVGCSVDVSGTNYGFHVSSTFAKRTGNLAAGAPEDAGDNFIGADNNNNAVATTNVVANADGSILERNEYVQTLIGKGVDITTTDSLQGKLGTDTELADRSLYDILNGSGPAAAATGARAGNDVSLYGVLRLIGASIPFCVEKTDGSVETGDDDIFTITGGPVMAQIYGEVTTLIGGASNGKLRITTTTPAATVDLNAGAVAIDNDAAGTCYYNVGATSVFTPVTANVILLDPVTVEPTWLYLSPGTVHFNGSAAQTGVIKWMMRYVPLGPSSLVVAAA